MKSAFFASLAAITLTGCTSAFTGPVEVTRFVADNPAALGQGTIALEFPDEISNENAKRAFTIAVAEELNTLGYQVVARDEAGNLPQVDQTATIRTSRNPVETVDQGGPVSVGVGGRTGSFGSGVGVGIGINLGGGRSGPSVVSELSVRISGSDGESLWEGRAAQPVSINSPYSDVDTSARALASALFRDFPGGNGDTVLIEVDELQGPE